MNSMKPAEARNAVIENEVVELVAVDNEELVTVTGGRSYGWGGGGWDVPDRPGGPIAGPIGPLPG